MFDICIKPRLYSRLINNNNSEDKMTKFKNFNYCQLGYGLVKTNAKEADIIATINYFKKQCSSFDGDMLRNSYETWLAVQDEGHITNNN